MTGIVRRTFALLLVLVGVVVVAYALVPGQVRGYLDVLRRTAERNVTDQALTGAERGGASLRALEAPVRDPSELLARALRLDDTRLLRLDRRLAETLNAATDQAADEIFTAALAAAARDGDVVKTDVLLSLMKRLRVGREATIDVESVTERGMAALSARSIAEREAVEAEFAAVSASGVLEGGVSTARDWFVLDAYMVREEQPGTYEIALPSWALGRKTPSDRHAILVTVDTVFQTQGWFQLAVREGGTMPVEIKEELGGFTQEWRIFAEVPEAELEVERQAIEVRAEQEASARRSLASAQERAAQAQRDIDKANARIEAAREELRAWGGEATVPALPEPPRLETVPELGHRSFLAWTVRPGRTATPEPRSTWIEVTASGPKALLSVRSIWVGVGGNLHHLVERTTDAMICDCPRWRRSDFTLDECPLTIGKGVDARLLSVELPGGSWSTLLPRFSDLHANSRSVSVSGSVGPYLLLSEGRDTTGCGAAGGSFEVKTCVTDLRSGETINPLDGTSRPPWEEVRHEAFRRLAEESFAETAADVTLTAWLPTWHGGGLEHRWQWTASAAGSVSDGRFNSYTRSARPTTERGPAMVAGLPTSVPPEVRALIDVSGERVLGGWSEIEGTPEERRAALAAFLHAATLWKGIDVP